MATAKKAAARPPRKKAEVLPEHRRLYIINDTSSVVNGEVGCACGWTGRSEEELEGHISETKE